MFENLRRDSARYANVGRWYTQSGFWITAIYRLGVWADSMPSRFLRIPIWALYRLLKLPFGIFNVRLWAGPGGSRIGAGLCLLHPSNITIGPKVEIGENCLIMREVTLARGHIPGTPKIGNNVDIYVGARVLGGVVIGDSTLVGANCVITKDVPPRSIVLTAPSRVMPRSHSPGARTPDRGVVANSESVPPAAG
jgi:serine O-acetyltransferase